MQNHSKWHSILMWVCVGIMGVYVFSLWGGGIREGGSGGSYWWVGLLLLCPLMHIFMMRGMHGSSYHKDKKEDANNSSEGS